MSHLTPYVTFGDPVNAAPAVAREISQSNATVAWATLGRAYSAGALKARLDYLERVAIARQRKCNKAYDLARGSYMRIQSVM